MKLIISLFQPVIVKHLLFALHCARRFRAFKVEQEISVHSGNLDHIGVHWTQDLNMRQSSYSVCSEQQE